MVDHAQNKMIHFLFVHKQNTKNPLCSAVYFVFAFFQISSLLAIAVLKPLIKFEMWFVDGYEGNNVAAAQKRQLSSHTDTNQCMNSQRAKSNSIFCVHN